MGCCQPQHDMQRLINASDDIMAEEFNDVSLVTPKEHRSVETVPCYGLARSRTSLVHSFTRPDIEAAFLRSFPSPSIETQELVSSRAGVLIGSSYFTVNYLEAQLTSLIKNSTVAALTAPETHNEVNQVFSTLLHRLLSEPSTASQVLSFLQSALDSESLEDSVLSLLLHSMESPLYSSEVLAVLKEATLHILYDNELIMTSHSLLKSLVNSLSVLSTFNKLQLSPPSAFALRPTTSYRLPTIEFWTLTQDAASFIRLFETQRALSTLKTREFPVPSLSTPQLQFSKIPAACPPMLRALEEFSAHYSNLLTPPLQEDPEQLYIEY